MKDLTALDQIQNLLLSKLDYKFSNLALLESALTHKSFSATDHNERLEFLGDAVFDLVISDILMRKFADDEGGLSKKRASLVNENVLAKLALQLQLPKFMILGRGELVTGGDKKPRLLASTLEALIGAIYLDGGFVQATAVIQKIFAPVLEEMSPESDFNDDFKTRLQELCQSEHKSAPTYRLKRETGPSHDREFVIEVEIQGKVFGQGSGRSKKIAEQNAAREALASIKKNKAQESFQEDTDERKRGSS
jgi:ribonuclease-3